jgi:hypothetical protein
MCKPWARLTKLRLRKVEPLLPERELTAMVLLPATSLPAGMPTVYISP